MQWDKKDKARDSSFVKIRLRFNAPKSKQTKKICQILNFTDFFFRILWIKILFFVCEVLQSRMLEWLRRQFPSIQENSLN